MASYNKTFLLGNLTRDPELKFTPQGAAVCKFSLAVNRKYKGSDGEMKSAVTYVNIVVWNKMGENCAKYLKKGSACFVAGRLEIRGYEHEGQKKTITEVVGEEIQFLSSGGAGRSESQGPRESDTGSAPEGSEYPGGDDGSDVPF